MPESMNLSYGLESPDACLKRKFRWLLHIEDVSAGPGGGANTLPPSKSARPNLSFKETEAQHLNETVYYPSKPEWRPINLTLYDLKKNRNPVMEWIKKVYDSKTGEWKPSAGLGGFKKEARLEMYDGCGQIIETWVFENVWPQTAEFGDLDMGDQEVSTIDLTLRYDRAYVEG